MPASFTLQDHQGLVLEARYSAPHKQQPRPRYQLADGRAVHQRRLIAATTQTSYAQLLAQCGDDEALAQALIAGDPEVPLAHIGHWLDGQQRPILLASDDAPVSEFKQQQRTIAPDGAVQVAEPAADRPPTLAIDADPLPWTGTLLAPDEVVRRFALGRKLCIQPDVQRSANDLLGMAQFLHDSGKLLWLGAESVDGPGMALVLKTNGPEYQGFLEGRVSGTSFRLVIHLSDMPLIKAVPKGGAA